MTSTTRRANRWMRGLRALLLPVVLFLTIASVQGETTASEPDVIVILNSYHHGYPWSDREARGIIEEVTRAFPRVQVHHEFLDTKRVPYTAGNRSYFDLQA